MRRRLCWRLKAGSELWECRLQYVVVEVCDLKQKDRPVSVDGRVQTMVAQAMF